MSKRDRENLLRGLVWIGVECRTALAELGDCGNDPKVTDYSTVNAVCDECATAAGFVPKDKVVGVWLDECGICHERKPCTDLHHDWRRKKEGGAS